MALVNCAECDKQISDKAPHCVHCGAPLASSSEEVDLGLAEKGCSGWVTSYSDTTRSGFIRNTKTGQSIQFDHTHSDNSLPKAGLTGLSVNFDVAPDGKPENIRLAAQHKIYNSRTQASGAFEGQESKACPFCSTSILNSATVCKGCGAEYKNDPRGAQTVLVGGLIPVGGLLWAAGSDSVGILILSLIIAAIFIVFGVIGWTKKVWVRGQGGGGFIAGGFISGGGDGE